MEDNKFGRAATTIRLTEELWAEINTLVKRTGMSQSDVIRQLLSMALGDQSRFVIKQSTDVPDDVKQELFVIAERLAEIKTQLCKIGNNINIRRRTYNSKRKAITDRISGLQSIKRDGNTYERLKREMEIQSLQQRLEEYDASQDTSMVSGDEWTRFQTLLHKFDRISMDIGEKIKW